MPVPEPEYGECALLDVADLPTGGLSDGVYGDITVSGAGTAMNINADTITTTELANDAVQTANILDDSVATAKIPNGAITLAKQATLAANSIQGNNTGSPATPIALTVAQVKTLLALANTDISGLGTLATQSGTFSGSSSGTNTGDQTTIAGITGTKAQFNTAITDGDILFVGDAPTAHTHLLVAGATDVTITAANLNTLDDGVNTALHFHDTDRARANHTGTQASTTILNFAADVAATAAVTANTAKVTNATHTGDVAGSGALTIANDAVTYAKMQNVSASDKILGRISGSGDVEEIACTAAGRNLIDDADAATQRSTLGLTDSAILPNVSLTTRLGFITGQYVDQSLLALASATVAGVADRMELYPYVPFITHTIDRIGVYVTTGVAATTCKLVAYSSDANGYASTRLFETSTLSTVTSSTFVEATVSQQFVAGTIYWIGVRWSGTATLRSIALGACPSFGLTSNSVAAYATCLRRTLAYATPATTPWSFVNGDRIASASNVSIRMRVA